MKMKIVKTFFFLIEFFEEGKTKHAVNVLLLEKLKLVNN